MPQVLKNQVFKPLSLEFKTIALFALLLPGLVACASTQKTDRQSKAGIVAKQTSPTHDATKRPVQTQVRDSVVAMNEDVPIASVAEEVDAGSDDDLVASNETSNASDESSNTETEAPYVGQIEIRADAVHFAYDSARLDQASQQVLQRLAEELMAQPEIQITVEGHCDERGTLEYNLSLGHLRAQTIALHLIRLGVDEERINPVSYGEERPLNEGHDRETLAQNRRGEFVFHGEGERAAMLSRP